MSGRVDAQRASGRSKTMYSKILVPLDGSKTAENVLPFVRSFARALEIPIELMAVLDVAEMARHIAADQASMLRTLVDDQTRRFENYLKGVTKNFPERATQCAVRKGSPAEMIIEAAAAEKGTVIAMATHGRSGVDRWLIGSVAEKILRGASNPLLLVRASEKEPAWDVATLKTVIVPLDGSELAESVLPSVEALAKKLNLEVILFGVYGGPYNAGGGGEGFFNVRQVEAFIAELRGETVSYLSARAEELKQKGLQKVSFTAKDGLPADEIIAFAGRTPESLIAMSTHGRSGVQRWMLGSVTETVVRHSGHPVFVTRVSS